MMQKGSEPLEVIIAGGGMVGMTLACALAGAGLRLAVLDHVPAESQLREGFDGRVSAIALGQKRLLEALGIWEKLALLAEPILDIRVSDGDSLCFVHYGHEEVGEEPFGWIIENRHLRRALWEQAKQYPNITFLSPVRIVQIHLESSKVEIELSDGRQLSAPLLVAADGRNSELRTMAGIRASEINYRHGAIVCTIAHEYSHQGVAQERFLPGGPFAALPMQGNRSSLVWTEKAELVSYYLALSDSELAEEIAERAGDYLGKIEVVGPRFSYPLSLMHAYQYVKPRLALIGDAAHTIHPIAGQGVNLGLRDVAALSEIIVDARRLGLDIGVHDLARYERWRRFDTLTMMAVTDGLNRLFTTSLAPVVRARRAGFWAVQHLPPLKRFFMRHAMGTVGDLPRLIRGEKL